MARCPYCRGRGYVRIRRRNFAFEIARRVCECRGGRPIKQPSGQAVGDVAKNHAERINESLGRRTCIETNR